MGRKILFDRKTLGWIAKQEVEEHPTTGPMANVMLPGQGFAMALLEPGDDISDLAVAMQELHPGGRMVEVSAPDTANLEENHRDFIRGLFALAGQNPPEESDPEKITPELGDLLYPRIDFLIVQHAERLSIPSFHILRRYHHMPPVMLIAYSDKILPTLQQDNLIMRNTYIFPIDVRYT